MFKSKRLLKSVISVFMAVLMVLLNISTSAVSFDASSTNEKIDISLQNKIANMDGNDLIKVSVWFTDIDYSMVYSTVKANLNSEKMIASTFHSEAIDLVFLKDSSEILDDPNILNRLNDSYGNVNTEDVQVVINKKREVAANMYQAYNDHMIDQIFSTREAISNTSSKTNDILISNKVTFVSHYAPNIEVWLTKEEIEEIAELDSVVEINYIETYENDSAESVDLDYDIDEEPKDMTFFDVTGLSVARDVWSLNGANMKVGMVEHQGHPRSSISDTATITRVYSPATLASNHATLVADIMVGRAVREDGTILFEGAIPNASLYSSSVDDEWDIKAAVEALLDQGVTAINCSFSYPTYCIANNEYGDIAKWYDHISVQHNVHLILSASNYGSAGIPRTNVSYNAIVVGACDNSGTILNDSSYITVNNFMNKPDVVAPGIVASMQYSSRGTSFAAPMVTSAVIQLSQAESVLMANPTLMKAVILGNAKITTSMESETSIYSTINGTTSAISQVYGAGMLNVTKAYTSVVNDLYYKTGTMSPYTYVASYQKNITKVKGKTLRFCLTWNKMNSISGEHTTDSVNYAILDNFKLTVTTPNGDVYTSQNLYDNKQMVTFEATENGYYSFKIDRIGDTGSGQVVRYSIGYSKQ